MIQICEVVLVLSIFKSGNFLLAHTVYYNNGNSEKIAHMDPDDTRFYTSCEILRVRTSLMAEIFIHTDSLENNDYFKTLSSQIFLRAYYTVLQMRKFFFTHPIVIFSIIV